jgi:hypothetical protein
MTKKVYKFFGSAKKVINFAAPKEITEGRIEGVLIVYDGNRRLLGGIRKRSSLNNEAQKSKVKRALLIPKRTWVIGNLTF